MSEKVLKSGPEGYVQIEVTKNGFDDFVYIITQEKGKFEDYKDSERYKKPTRIIEVGYRYTSHNKQSEYTGGNIYYIPTELDIFISYAPVKNRPTRTMLATFNGSIKIQSKFIKDISKISEPDTDKSTVYWRLGSP